MWLNRALTYDEENRLATTTGSGAAQFQYDSIGKRALSIITQTSGPQRYYPYGAHQDVNSAATEYGYTGQREEADLGLYDDNARWYDPYVGRFIQPDAQE